MKRKAVRVMGFFLALQSWALWFPASGLFLPTATMFVRLVPTGLGTLATLGAVAVAFAAADCLGEARPRRHSAHGVALTHPARWRPEAALRGAGAGQVRFQTPTPGAEVVVQAYPGDVRAAVLDEWKARVREDARLDRPRTEPVCRSLAGSPSRGFEYTAHQGRDALPGQRSRSPNRDGRTLGGLLPRPGGPLRGAATGNRPHPRHAGGRGTRAGAAAPAC